MIVDIVVDHGEGGEGPGTVPPRGWSQQMGLCKGSATTQWERRAHAGACFALVWPLTLWMPVDMLLLFLRAGWMPFPHPYQP